MRQRLALIVAVVVATSRLASACHDCGEYTERALGVSDDGLLVTRWQSGTGETDYTRIWGLRLRRGAEEVCRLEVAVGDSETELTASGPRRARCERLARLSTLASRECGDGTCRARVARFDEKRLLARVASELGLTPLEHTSSLPVRVLHVDDGADAGLRFAVWLDGKQLGAVTIDGNDAMQYFGGSWAVSFYAHPRWDGVFIRLMTLTPPNESGRASDCHAAYDGFLVVPRASLPP